MKSNFKKIAIFGVLMIALTFAMVAFTSVNAADNDTNLYADPTATPSANQPRQVRIDNNTSRNITIYLDGEEYDYEIVSPSGNKYYTIEKGTYQYSYTLKPCGIEVTGETSINFDGHIFELKVCPPAPRLAQDFAINSHMGEDVVVEFTPNFSGDYELLEEDAAFSLNVLAGERNVYNNNNFVEGDYIYSYEACGDTKGGTIRLLFDYKNEITIKGCEALALEQELSDLGMEKRDLVKLRLNNRTTEEIGLTLIGPKTYYYSVGYGVDIVTVYAGTYNYIYAIHGQRYEGTIKVSPNGDTVMMVPGSVQ